MPLNKFFFKYEASRFLQTFPDTGKSSSGLNT